MSISSSFLWRFLDDVWDLLPTEDRELFQAYWSGQLQIAANLEQKTIEAAMSTEVANVPVYLTERWGRFLMNEDVCDLFTQTDDLVLTGYASIALSKETAFYDTLGVSSPSGQIAHEETMQFFDDSVRELRYGYIIAGTISVSIDGKEYTANRDYTINLETGTIQALPDGRIPPTELLTIRYQHSWYSRGLDYEVDEVNATVRRLSSTAIADGAEVAVLYSYNGTATLSMESSAGAVEYSTLTDETQDFSTLLPNRTLTVKSGPNVGTYPINAVVSPTEIQIVGNFPQVQETDVVYSIDAFPHGVKVASNIVSIPVLQDLIDDPSLMMIEGVDYRVSGGILAVRSAFPMSLLGSEDVQERQVWAETVRVDEETPYRNFGVLIDFYRSNSEAYKLALQGLWYTFWTGSTPGNLQRGLHILLGLPYARKAGTVSRVDTDVGEIDITEDNGRIFTYYIPDGLDPVVELYDEVARFDSLTTGVDIIDRNNEPGFVESYLGRAGVSRFLTDNASRGPGNTDETKALTLLENHLFLPQVLVEAIEQRVNVQELVTFLDNMKPKGTEYVFSFAATEEEGLVFSEELSPLDQNLDLSTTVSNNEWNQADQLDLHRVQSAAALPTTLLVSVERFTAEIIGGGTQATGNFRDSGIDFADLGIDRDDTVRIEAGAFKGNHRVLKRISSSTLSLDIPDAAIVATPNIHYVVIPEEMQLDHDAITLCRENLRFAGTDYPAPTTLNTKTDIDFSATNIDSDAMKALLLVDIGIAGGEVQDILDADADLGEFNVNLPPGTVTRDHEIASAAIKRVLNTGPTVTDAFAI